MTNNNGITSWFKQNAWAIIIVVAGFIAMNATNGTRLNAMEAKLAEYPSQDFFIEKFKNTDEKIIELQNQIKDLKVEVRSIK